MATSTSNHKPIDLTESAAGEEDPGSSIDVIVTTVKPEEEAAKQCPTDTGKESGDQGRQ